MLAGLMVFLFLWISKRKPPTLSKKIYCPSVHSEWCRQDCSIFYIHRNRFYKRNEHLYNNSLCVVLYRTFRAVVFQKRQTHADENYRLYSRIRRNYRNQFRRNCQHGHLVRRYDDSLFNNICGGRQHRCEKSHNRTRSVPCNRFSAFNRRFYIACVGHMLRWQYWFDKC